MQSPAPRGSIAARTLLLSICFVATPQSWAEVFDLTQEGKALRLNIPEEVETVTSLLIVGNYGRSDVRAEATNPELVAFARRNRCALLPFHLLTK